MEAIGVGSDSYRTETFPVGSVAETRIEFSPDGLQSDVSWSVAVSIDGDITSGSGPLRPPVLVDEVASVPLDDALMRLSRIAPSTEVVPTVTTTLSEPAINPADIAVVTFPPPTTAPLPVVLPTITGVEAGLASVWDVDNRLWLVPAIVVTGDHGFVTSIPVISADLVTIVSADLVDVPVRTGPPLTVPAPHFRHPASPAPYRHFRTPRPLLPRMPPPSYRSRRFRCHPAQTPQHRTFPPSTTKYSTNSSSANHSTAHGPGRSMQGGKFASTISTTPPSPSTPICAPTESRSNTLASPAWLSLLADSESTFGAGGASCGAQGSAIDGPAPFV